MAFSGGESDSSAHILNVFQDLPEAMSKSTPEGLAKHVRPFSKSSLRAGSVMILGNPGELDKVDRIYEVVAF